MQSVRDLRIFPDRLAEQHLLRFRYLQLVSSMLKRLLEQKDAPIFALIRPKALEELLTAEYAWPWYGQLMKVPQTIAYMLQINEWLTYYKISVI